MTLNAEFAKLAAVEKITSAVIKPQSLPGIDISPLIDALMQFLLKLLEDCPKQDIRRAVDQSSRRPLIRAFWRTRLHRKMPQGITDQLPNASAELLDAAAEMNEEDWAAV